MPIGGQAGFLLLPSDIELREDGSYELREDLGLELRDGS
jgi:hypothetical protein